MTVLYDVEQRTTKHPYSTAERLQATKVISNTVDFSKYLSATAVTVGCASADSVKVLPIPAGSFVVGIRVKVITAEGATQTVDIGDSVGNAGWGSGINLNAATDSFSFNATTTPTYGVGKYYAAAADIYLLLNHTADTAVVQISALVADLNFNIG
jgi:hypothetical protein